MRSLLRSSQANTVSVIPAVSPHSAILRHVALSRMESKAAATEPDMALAPSKYQVMAIKPHAKQLNTMMLKACLLVAGFWMPEMRLRTKTKPHAPSIPVVANIGINQLVFHKGRPLTTAISAPVYSTIAVENTKAATVSNGTKNAGACPLPKLNKRAYAPNTPAAVRCAWMAGRHTK